MVTYELTKVTKMTVVFIARDSVAIFKVYGATVDNFDFIASVNQIALRPKANLLSCASK